MKRLTIQKWLTLKWLRKKDRLHLTDLFNLLLAYFIWCDVKESTIQKDIGDYSITITFIDKTHNR